MLRTLSFIFNDKAITQVAGSSSAECAINGFIKDKNQQLYMNGSEVLLFTMANVPDGTLSLLNQANLSYEDVDLFFFGHLIYEWTGNF